MNSPVLASKSLARGLRLRSVQGAGLAACVVGLLSTSSARSELIEFSVDSSQSFLSLAGNVATFPIEEQSPGSLQTSISGTLSADLHPSIGVREVILISSSAIVPSIQAGPFLPFDAPAVFAGQATVGALNGYGAVRNVNADISGVSSINALGEFDATVFSVFISADFDYVLDPLFPATSFPVSDSVANESLAPGTLNQVGNILELTIPLELELTSSQDGVTLTQVYTGMLVATARVPELSTLGLTGLSLGTAIFAVGCRRRHRSRSSNVPS